MEIQAAVTKVQNKPIILVWVTKYVLRSKVQADAFISELQHAFLGFPVVLMSMGSGEQPVLYSGDKALVDGLSRAPLMNLPWERYRVK